MLNQYSEAPILTSFKFPLPTVGAACAESWSNDPEDADIDVRKAAHRAKPIRDRLDFGSVDRNAILDLGAWRTV